jgi:hypothetical protein
VSDDGEEVVTDDERSHQTAASDDGKRRVTDRDSDAGLAETSTGVEDAAESFLDLEADMGPPDGERVRGRAVDVERIDAAAVPPAYPVTITTGEALALTLALRSGDETTVYFEVADGAPGDRLARLLEGHGVTPDRFADLHGESLLLDVEGGHHVPYVPPGGPKGSPLGVYGVGAGLGANLLVFLLAVVGLGNLLSVPVVLAWLLGNVVSLPVATWLDARYLLTHTDWEQGPGFWATLAAIPGVNVVSSLAYLWTRRQSGTI